MAKKKKAARKGPTKAVSDKVLKEFNHKCAICGCPNPQLHHIDEDPSNSVVENLLPLCPNCHLLDAHSPTERFTAERLRWFRAYKDPAIFDPRFTPVFERCLYAVSEKTASLNRLFYVQDFLWFIGNLQMGEYYQPRISGMFGIDIDRYHILDVLNHQDPDQLLLSRSLAHRAAVNRRSIETLTVEQLRYQKWLPPSSQRSSAAQ